MPQQTPEAPEALTSTELPKSPATPVRVYRANLQYKLTSIVFVCVSLWLAHAFISLSIKQPGSILGSLVALFAISYSIFVFSYRLELDGDVLRRLTLFKKLEVRREDVAYWWVQPFNGRSNAAVLLMLHSNDKPSPYEMLFPNNKHWVSLLLLLLL